MAGFQTLAGSMSDSQFNEAIRTFPRLSAHAIDACRSVLVNATPINEAVLTTGLSRQRIYQCANNIYGVFCPRGWISRVVTLPPDQMLKVEEMEAVARAAHRGQIESKRRHFYDPC